MSALKTVGVDLSRYQSFAYDTGAAKRAGLEWVYAKATEGLTVVDPLYGKHRENAKKAGLPFGAYHFARPDRDGRDAVAEARKFLQVAKIDVKNDLIPMLDFEDLGGLAMSRASAWINAFCAEVKRQIGVEPVVYLPSSWDIGAAGAGRIIWRARYNNDNRPPALPCNIFQFSNGELGTPKRIAGFPGKTDLNAHMNGFKTASLKITKPKPKPKYKYTNLRLAEISLDFRLVDKKNKAGRSLLELDIEKLFKRAKTSYDVIGGTEGFEKKTRVWLEKYAKEAGFRLANGAEHDQWVAVRKTLVHRDWDTFWNKVVPGTYGHNTSKGAFGVQFWNNDLGWMTFSAVHLLTKGRPGDPNPAYRVNIEKNRKIMESYGDEMKKRAVGNKIGFLMGDFNIIDGPKVTLQNGPFLGQPFQSAARATGKYPNTGHGPIDSIAKWRADARVKFIRYEVFPDAKFGLHTDHYLLEADARVRHLKPIAA